MRIESISRLIAVVTLVYLVAMVVDATPYLRGPAPMHVEWRWRRYDEPAYERVWPLLVALVSYLVFVAWMERLDVERLPPRQLWVLVLMVMVAALLVQGTVLYLARPDVITLLFERNASRAADGYYTALLDHEGIGTLLGSYPERMPTFAGDHARTHPPGFPLIHWAVRETVGRWAALRTWVRWNACPTLRVYGLTAEEVTSALALGVATPVVSAMATLPLYALARKRGNVRDGLRAAALFALVPAAVLFAPQVDQLYPLLTGLILWAFLRGWEGRHAPWFLASGLLLSVATFLSLGLAAMGLWLGVYALTRWLAERPAPYLSWRQLVVAGLWVGLGSTSVWLICRLAFGLDPIAVYRTGMAQHYQIVTSGRRYALWAWYNLYDYAAFLGLPLATALGARALASARCACSGFRGGGRQLDAAAIATAVTVLVLTLSGTSRGEVARMWLFLLPPVILVGVSSLQHAGRRPFIWIASLQAASVLVFALYLDVVPVLPLESMERLRQSAPEPSVSEEARVLFGDQIQFLGYDMAPQPAQAGQALELRFRWRSAGEPAQSYKVFVHLVDAEGNLRAQVDGIPLDWTLPTTCWVRDEVLVDRYRVALPDDLPPGAYTPAVGYYDEATGTRLVVTMQTYGSDGPESPPLVLGDRLELSAVRVE